MESESIRKSGSKLYVVLQHDGDGPIPPEDNPAVDFLDITAHYYAIYAVSVPDVGPDDDADAGSSPPLPPEKKPKLSDELEPVATLNLGVFPCYMSFAHLGSSIYMFGGWEGTLQSRYPPREGTWYPPNVTSPSFDVYIIDTTRLPDPNTPIAPLALKPGDPIIEKGPSLNTLKNCSYSVSLLGKIFAIPTSFDYNHSECAEFLDPSTNPNQWRCIPNPCCELSFVEICYVVGSCILAVTFEGPVYQLDATDPEQGWKESTGKLRDTSMILARPAASVVDGLLCSWLRVHQLSRKNCFWACSLEDLRYIYVRHPSSGPRMGGEIIWGERYVLDLGDGRAAILTGGFTKPPEFHLVLNIVRLEKTETGAVEIHPLRSFDHKIDKVNTKYVNICGCFPMMRGSGGQSSAAYPAPCVAFYSDVVIDCRVCKRWDRTKFPIE